MYFIKIIINFLKKLSFFFIILRLFFRENIFKKDLKSYCTITSFKDQVKDIIIKNILNNLKKIISYI